MSDKLYTYPIDKLLKWILADLRNDSVFGYSKKLFYIPCSSDPYRFKRYDQLLETPIGVAAGPHSQMAQNIILAWLFGARYIELKTVQTLDELEITKPCIDMTDEGYNCEWSQELKIHQSFDEYLNAWIIIHILKDKFGWDTSEAGVIFNISVGYNLEGIKKPNVQWFLDKMNNCSEELNQKIEIISKFYPQIKLVEIPSQISNNVTLSTMHGCPPDEIESIVNYLITERKLHTAVKLNPTLLGNEKLREILNSKLGYDITIPDEAFEHDLKWDDAVSMISRLQKNAEENNLEFGLKLTNTLESLNTERFLPENEKMVYMSGRALHPISINLAEKLQTKFDGKLDFTFSAGVDAFNVADTLACGLKPITVCSDILKPGGYGRLVQYLDELNLEFEKCDAENIEEFIASKAGNKSEQKVELINLKSYADQVINDKKYKASEFKYENIKTKRELTVFDCVQAPCVETCAITQDVPEYMYYTSRGEFDKAYEVILKANPLPNITGMVCDHLCQSKCTRLNYDNPLLIREIKRFISEKESNDFQLKPKSQIGIKAAVIGAGPAGLSAAYFLALEGIKVTVYESKTFAGGMASDAIPVFRIDEKLISQDVENIKSLGVEFKFGTEVNRDLFDQIRNGNDFVFISVGAQLGKKLNINGEDSRGVFDQIKFLADILHGEKVDLGKSAAIIGGGLSAVDAARTAKRLVGKDGKVNVVYRRTKNEMPCGFEEVEVMEEEGIEIIELIAPKEIRNDGKELILVSSKMELGEKDSSGRRRPIKIEGSEFELRFDSIITAIGQDIVLDFFPEEKLIVNEVNFETQIKNVFAGGDAIRGADSLINAISDGQKVSEIILERANKKLNLENTRQSKMHSWEFQKKLAQRKYGIDIPSISIEERVSFDTVHPRLTTSEAMNEADRCLYCNDVCNICVGVCPNLANISIETYPVEAAVNGKTFKVEQPNQIINIGDFCNECGNCTTFCPTSGDPYKTKPRFYLTEESFSQEDNCYYIENGKLFYKNNGSIITLYCEGGKVIYKGASECTFNKSLNLIEGNLDESETSQVFELYFLLKHLKNHELFRN